ncbi:hypothetical protein RQP53_09835 [Paucibacter sp. APW11]|uniref:DUF4178 domain-containing protein n=1 Tax=Roseateles aquae TaxID=3077235 RepID=A0ABU3PAE7_9BURK|nr:hypothetical protein [Paucibacter sp. APW11]MDT8999564.1 hypothetical protein [Paucibacter sp. APW11]
MQRTINMPAGQMWMELIEGEVVSQQKWSETQIRATGGGGYINQGSGLISDVQLSTSSSEQLEFWVRSDDGKETAFRLADTGLALRAGQRVRIARGGKLGSKPGTPLLTQNFASGETHALVPDWLNWAMAQGLLRRPLWYRLLSNWLTLAIAVIAALLIVYAHKHPSNSGALAVLLEPAHGPISLLEGAQLVLSQAASGGASLIADLSQWSASSSQPGKDKLPANLFSLLLFTLFAWASLAVALKLVGRLILSLHWKRSASRDVRQRVMTAFEAPAA